MAVWLSTSSACNLWIRGVCITQWPMRLCGRLCIAVLAVWTSSLGSQETWRKSLTKNGIVIETRKVAGSAYKEFRATMIVRSDLEKAMAVMRDIPGYTRWMKDCTESRQIAKTSANSGIVHSVQATPWPIAEREAVVRYHLIRSKNPHRLRVAINAASDALPATKGRVRIEKLNGYWQFTEFSAGQLEVVYSLHSEPGGDLPAWAVSGMIAHLPYETLTKLRARLEGG